MCVCGGGGGGVRVSSLPILNTSGFINLIS